MDEIERNSYKMSVCRLVQCGRLFVVTALIGASRTRVHGFRTLPTPMHHTRQTLSSSPTALNVWWFGGTESSEISQDGADSCELVAVRIERTSSNSRKIAGSIIVATPLVDVWAILTDYNKLATHVPNLVESRIVTRQSNGEQGDGSYCCKLFQKGAQKIVGFEFGASVTMDMTEKVVAAAESVAPERFIGFKCVDSFFFSEFDGEWRAKEQTNAATGDLETVLDYVVDVRPKGPVPVAALEWRIREDVPTNLRAVKKAATEVGLEGVLASRKQRSVERLTSRSGAASAGLSSQSNGVRRPTEHINAIKRATVRRSSTTARSPVPVRSSIKEKGGVVVASKTGVRSVMPAFAKRRRKVIKRVVNAKPAANKRVPFKVSWEPDETMAAYLRE